MSKKSLPKSLLSINTESTAMFEATLTRHVTEVFLLTVSYVFTGRNCATGKAEQLSETPAIHISFYARKKMNTLQLSPAQNNPENWYNMLATEQFFAQLIAGAKEADPKASFLTFESLPDDNHLINILDQSSQFSLVETEKQLQQLPLSTTFKDEFLDAMKDGEDDCLPAAFFCDLRNFDENGMAIPP